MKGRKGRLTFCLVGIGFLLLFSVLLSSGSLFKTREEKIFDLVLSNQEALEAAARSCLRGEAVSEDSGAFRIEGVYPGDHPIVQFFVSGSGLAPSSVYQGFYYSEDDLPAAFQNSGCPLVPVSEDEWVWDGGADTDNGGVTKRITERWFYYEAWF